MNIEQVRSVFQMVFGHGPADPPVNTVDDMLDELEEVLGVVERPLQTKIEGMLLEHALEQALSGAFEKPRTRRKIMKHGFHKSVSKALRRGHPSVARRAARRSLKIRKEIERSRERTSTEALAARIYRSGRARSVPAATNEVAQPAEEAKEVVVKHTNMVVEFCKKAHKVAPGHLSKEVDENGRIMRIFVQGGKLEFAAHLNGKDLKQAARSICRGFMERGWVPTRFIPDPAE